MSDRVHKMSVDFEAMEKRIAELEASNADISQVAARFMTERDQWRDFAVALRKIIKGAKLVTYGNSPVDHVLSEFDRLMEASR